MRYVRFPMFMVMCVGGLMLAFYNAQAQEFRDDPVALPTPSANQPHQLKQVQRTRTVVETYYQPLTPDELRQRAEINKAVHDLSEVDDKKREAAGKDLERLLGDAFDRDMRDRERKLEELEQRVDKLRKAYEMRLDARDEIITHRVRGYELQAQGLAYPEGVAPNAAPASTRSGSGTLPQAWVPRAPGAYQTPNAPGPGVVPQLVPQQTPVAPGVYAPASPERTLPGQSFPNSQPIPNAQPVPGSRLAPQAPPTGLPGARFEPQPVDPNLRDETSLDPSSAIQPRLEPSRPERPKTPSREQTPTFQSR